MAHRVLVVLPTRTYRARAFLAAAARQGFEVVVASDEPSSLAELMGDRQLTLKPGPPAAAAELAAELHARSPLDAVVGVDESSVLAAAAIAERLGLRHHPLAAVAATRDKRVLRARLAAAGVPQPAFATLSSGARRDELAAAAEHVGGWPVVAKPVDQAASRGVLRCDDLDALAAAAVRIEALLAASCGASGPVPLLLEGYVDGAEVAVEGLVRGGRVEVLVVLDKPEPMPGPTFEETMLVTPSRHPPATQAQLAGMTVAAAGALGLRDGPLHAELRIPLAGPVVIEVAARTVGGLCSRALRFGPDALALEELVLRHAAGLGPDDVTRAGPASGVLMLPAEAAGTLTEVTGIDDALGVPGVTGVEITVPVGTRVVPLPEGDRYLGFVFSEAPTPLEAELALREARRRLRLVVA